MPAVGITTGVTTMKNIHIRIPSVDPTFMVSHSFLYYRDPVGPPRLSSLSSDTVSSTQPSRVVLDVESIGMISTDSLAINSDCGLYKLPFEILSSSRAFSRLAIEIPAGLSAGKCTITIKHLLSEQRI